MPVDDEVIKKVGAHLANTDAPMKARYRALFTLKSLGGKTAIDEIAKHFADDSSLLKHELAYCLGQMQDDYALNVLRNVVTDESQHVIVRHEAAEALGAIGNPTDLQLLAKFSKDSHRELAETCEIAVDRINWLAEHFEAEKDKLSTNPFSSVDPAPPFPLDEVMSVEDLTRQLLDENLSMFQRYRAMFTLRNICSEESILALCKGFSATSALFRHEVAYVLGQLSHPVSEPALTTQLCDCNENGMVRHECAEALGSIATESCMETLKQFLNDSERLVRESCEVALDMAEYELSNEFQYANVLEVVS